MRKLAHGAGRYQTVNVHVHVKRLDESKTRLSHTVWKHKRLANIFDSISI